jgi:voltage-gated potassium channel
MQGGLGGLRRRLGRLFDDDLSPTRATRVFHAALAALILVNVSGVVLESVESLNQRFGAVLWWLEQVATALFTVEYLLRAWACVEIHHGQFRHPLWGRLRYLRGFFALIDLAAILPAILGLLGAGDLRTLRLLRLLRMLKLTRHATIFNLLWAVFREEARSIGAVLFILMLTLTISASLIYMIEGEAQPEGFSSIPAAMWWAVETLTTVGYGDLVPVTVAGKILGGVVTIIGVAAVALFTSLITISFSISCGCAGRRCATRSRRVSPTVRSRPANTKRSNNAVNGSVFPEARRLRPSTISRARSLGLPPVRIAVCC